MYWKHHPLSFVSGPSYTRKQSYISACRSPAGFIRGARGRTGGYPAVSPMVKTRRDRGDEALRSGLYARVHRGETWMKETASRRNREQARRRCLGTVVSNRSGRGRERARYSPQERVISLGLSSPEYEGIFTCASDALLVSLCYSEFPSSRSPSPTGLT